MRPDLRAVAEAYKLPAPQILPSSETLDAAIQVMAGTIGVSELVPTRIITTPVEDVTARFDMLKHLVEKRGEDREKYAHYLMPTLLSPFEVWRVAYEGGEFRNRYIGLFLGPRSLAVSVQVSLEGALLWNMMQEAPVGINKHRRGQLIWTKK